MSSDDAQELLERSLAACCWHWRCEKRDDGLLYNLYTRSETHTSRSSWRSDSVGRVRFVRQSKLRPSVSVLFEWAAPLYETGVKALIQNVLVEMQRADRRAKR